ncbi:Gfo/Idh/MocA family oxidoreductase [Bacillus sp. FJAT-29790]|uniref:Gfo/Idh/MocA family oxidoreductase n=1 Tax=Bacillus sp. FJAT-29790 TaxID=1895002 RepID=UPI001C24E245|nr:Gfo/Idh/MocA family oxidoreductase [Bacillus sp. FJAT-29790]MBU8879257.1 Gfo/Idh/MocA family oxidoreductase [Bacillus sp. FJAT-29790]
MTENIRVAVIGLGRLGSIHAENLANHINGVQLQYVVDPFEGRAEQVAKELGVERWAKNPMEVLEDPDLDAVIIATPTKTHAEMVKLAALNKKHIFVEKPITETIEETTEVIETIKENNVLCQVGFMRRFHPAFIEAKKRIEAGDIGKPIYFKGFTRDNPPGKYAISPQIEFLKHSGGIFLDLAIHDFDIARYLMGSEVTTVLSTGSIVVNTFMEEYGDVDQAITYLQFSSGAAGDIESSRNSPYGFDIGCEIIGTEGAIQIPTIRQQEVTLLDAMGKHDLGPNFPPSLNEAFKMELNEFVHSIMNLRGTSCNEMDGKAALEIAVAATESFKTGKKVKLNSLNLTTK